MKTMMKSLAVLGGLLLLAGCSAAADDTPARTNGLGYGPGWRHEQMAKAWEKGEMPGPMMMRVQGGPGWRGYGPPLDADGKIDTSKMPDWCPLKQPTQAPVAR